VSGDRAGRVAGRGPDQGRARNVSEEILLVNWAMEPLRLWCVLPVALYEARCLCFCLFEVSCSKSSDCRVYGKAFLHYRVLVLGMGVHFKSSMPTLKLRGFLLARMRVHQDCSCLRNLPFLTHSSPSVRSFASTSCLKCTALDQQITVGVWA
jgi:hypothetical protein